MKKFLWIGFLVVLVMVGCSQSAPPLTEEDRFIQKGMALANTDAPELVMKGAVVDSASAKKMTYKELDERFGDGHGAGVSPDTSVWVVTLNGQFFYSAGMVAGPTVVAKQRTIVFNATTGAVMSEVLSPDSSR